VSQHDLKLLHLLSTGARLDDTNFNVAAGVVSIQQDAHIVNAKVNYTTLDLDTEAELIAAFNTTNGKINAILTALREAGILATS
jgi:hypothetical protein